MKYKLILEVLDIKDSTKETIEVVNSQLLREIPAAPIPSRQGVIDDDCHPVNS